MYDHRIMELPIENRIYFKMQKFCFQGENVCSSGHSWVVNRMWDDPYFRVTKLLVRYQ